MKYTRVDTKKLQVAIAEATQHLDKARDALAAYTVVMTDEERAGIPRPPGNFGEAGRALARGAVDKPELAAVVDFDSEAVVEDLDNAASLAQVTEKVAEIQQQIADTRLQWLAEAWVPSLALYAVAKVRAKSDGALRTIVEPLANVFAARRATPRGRKENSPPNG